MQPVNEPLSHLPETFDELRGKVPDGFSLSERIVDPIVEVERIGARIVIRLAGRRMVRGEPVLMPAPSIRHMWVVDGTVLRPLPGDI